MEKRCHSRMMLGQFWLSMRTSFVAVTKPVKQKKDQRSPARVGRVLDQVEGRSAIGHHPTEFAIQVGVLCRQASNGLGDGGVLLGPVVTSPRNDFHSARVEPSVHAISIELDLMQPVWAVRCLLYERRELRFNRGR
jgi:hypothetical protein